MRLTRLTIRDYRNLAAVDLACHEGLNLLLGANGAGKTNIAEAVLLLNIGQSFRARRLDELVRFGAAQAVVQAEVVTRGTEEQFTVAIAADGAKSLLRHGKKIAQHELVRSWTAVLFSPDDLALVRGAPVVRRRFLDLWLARREAGYFAALQRYWQVVQQRNRLLADFRNPRREAGLADWDAQLVQQGAALLAARARGLADLAPRVAQLYRAMHGVAEFGLAYRAAVEIAGDPAELAARLAKKLGQARAAELRRGLTLVGPHRDELEFTVGNRPARYFCSCGEQQLLALALRLAEYESLREAQGEAPVLILDDPFATLDQERRRRVLEAVTRVGQCFLTATELLPSLPAPGRLFRIAGGTVTAVTA